MTSKKALDKLQEIAKEQPGLLELLDNLIDNNLDPVFVVSADEHHILKASINSEMFTGRHLHDLIGGKFIEVFPEEAHKELKSMFRKAKRGRNFCFDYQYQGPDHKTKYVSFHCFQFHILTETYLFVQCKDNTEEYIAKVKADEYLHDLKIANSRLLELSVTDELTKLYNIRYFNERIIEEHAKATRYKYPYSVLFLDVDYFKKFNDQYGHIAGDEILRQLAGRISEFMRQNDIIARYGGEEFIILCPYADKEKGVQTAERLRKFIEDTKFTIPGFEKHESGAITVSVGLSVFPEHSSEPTELINLSDSAMYHSKSGGRNTVTVYDPKKKPKKKEYLD